MNRITNKMNSLTYVLYIFTQLLGMDEYELLKK